MSLLKIPTVSPDRYFIIFSYLCIRKKTSLTFMAGTFSGSLCNCRKPHIFIAMKS